jgi:hypothetical protein
MSAAAYPLTEEGLADALAALGDTPGTVAETLTDGGYRGVRDDCNECPTALYLLDVIVGITAVDVDRVTVTATSDTPAAARISENWQVRVLAVVPIPVREFIAAFDDGNFPDLDIAPPEDDEPWDDDSPQVAA